jgi:hypothetical protein
MTQSQQKPDPAAKGRPFLEEADIGSGEKTPAQHETDQMIREIPPLPPAGQRPDAEGGASRRGEGAQQQQPTQR